MPQLRAAHALTPTALFDEVVLQAAELPVAQVIGLVDEAEREVRSSTISAFWKESSVW